MVIVSCGSGASPPVQRSYTARCVTAIASSSLSVALINDKPVKCLTLGHDDAEWITSGSKTPSLSIRKCYETLFVLVTEFTACRRDRSHAILTGSYGVGKRSFLGYMIYRLSQWEQPPMMVVDLPGVFCLIDSDGHVTLGHRGSSFQCELHDHSTFYLCDASSDPHRQPLSDAYIRARSMIITAPVLDQVTSIEKQRTCRRLVMPSWSASELEHCRHTCYPHVEPLQLHERQEMWGGIIKWTLGVPLHESVAQFHRSVSLLSLDSVVKLAENHGYTARASELNQGSYLIDMVLDGDQTFECRDASLCSYLACMRLMDAEPSNEKLIVFMEAHRYCYRVKMVIAQFEQQLLRRLMM